MSNVHNLNGEQAKSWEDYFEDFWEQQLIKVGKVTAREKFRRIVNGGLQTRTKDYDAGGFMEIYLEATPEQLVEAAKAYRRKQTDPKTYKAKEYTSQPTQWLNKGRFMDEL
jgi:hypothetical protein